ncbi:hypothetical protein KKC1_26790 [Calderihabitans maritimus]|uniref:Aldehyde ferredoxin oxidoreductase N-terminal domain-containing protein n=1 Tax=Calderihabitans maritimus TaxID=1246530 RepID=A0A1Z5HVW7_9FIRM|nr:hypothetical protein KKC1_26790 [Calderihabitans maritimus]
MWGEADAGGTWGAVLKRAGFDGLIIQGTADRPVYLFLYEGKVQIRDAEHLWGLNTYETDEAIKAETTPKAVIVSIGPAGEKLSCIAGIFNDGKHARAAGRCGLGAVMGSKKLKAIAVLGNKKVPVADPERLNISNKKLAPKIMEKLRRYRDYGTAGGVLGAAALGDLPVKNWTVGSWMKGAEKISGEVMTEKILVGRYHCASCVVGCGRIVKIDKGPYRGVDGAGPEYETLAGLGSVCMVDNLNAIALANQLCNQYGIDTISTGHAVAFAIEAYEKGLITKADTGGMELRWGDPDVVIALVHQIGKREGIGEILADGVKRAAEKIGGLASELALEVKGLEPAFHDPRALSSLAVAYATHPRGACHRGGSHTMERTALPELGYDKPLDRFVSEGKGALTAVLQDYYGLYNSLKLCQFIAPAIAPTDVLEWLNAVTGWEMDLKEFLEAGERHTNLKRMYNVRCGISRKDDRLPLRLLTHKLEDGGAAGMVPHLGTMLSDYYRYRGWTQEGIPTPDKLRQLGLCSEINHLPGNIKITATKTTSR